MAKLAYGFPLFTKLAHIFSEKTKQIKWKGKKGKGLDDNVCAYKTESSY